MSVATKAGSHRLGVLVARRGVIRGVFWVYALVLFAGTHWPALDVRVEGIDRPDLIVHLAAFSLWTTFFWATGYAGHVGRWSTLPITALAGCGYAAIDERLQAIPWIRRNCAWDDVQANWMGVGIGVAVAGVITAWGALGDRSARRT